MLGKLLRFNLNLWPAYVITGGILCGLSNLPLPEPFALGIDDVALGMGILVIGLNGYGGVLRPEIFNEVVRLGPLWIFQGRD